MAIMKTKKEDSYREIFRKVKQECPGFLPTLIMADFEKALKNAVKEEFPTTQIIGCWFHYAQVMRNIFIIR